MTKSTRNTLRIASIVLAILVILMDLGFIPNIVNYHFWVMVISYFLLVLSIRA
ncbi:hypothetical protein [Ekhidna sp. To15]|uniref:hypothetical protein n=1 Tax=Ekhidna sp. To15 TaxID=3395267 RepID=UPI003F52406E